MAVLERCPVLNRSMVLAILSKGGIVKGVHVEPCPQMSDDTLKAVDPIGSFH